MRKLGLLGVLVAGALMSLMLPTGALASHTPVVGELRNWVGLDTTLSGSGLYVKQYQLRGVGKNIEIWVAKGFSNPGGRPGAYDLEFPSNERKRARGFDCRSGETTQITDAMVNYLIAEFDNNIYPKESQAFSVPPPRAGERGALSNDPRFHTRGKGDNIVVLVDNVRDDNFYSYQNEGRFSYIAGFHYGTLNNFFDRHFMSIDAYDWIHRTGANPRDDTFPGALPEIGTLTRLCGNRAAVPLLYEGTFAHEYQHLLIPFVSPGESTWVNEGLSDYAQTLTGYVDSTIAPPAAGADGHIYCFLGFLPNSLCGGAENSLTLWNDQSNQQNEVLADYGAAYTFMLMLADRYGVAFMSAFHREPLNGIAGLQAVLTRLAAGKTAQSAMNEWAALIALDKALDDGRTLNGGTKATYQTPSLKSEVNWNTAEAYSTPGAPPNGSDYVRARDAGGTFLSAGQINSLSFDGASIFAPDPIADWEVVNRGPADANNPALYSGTRDNMDSALVKQVALPATGATLSLRHQYNLENHWDFGFVQVSDNGGASYKSIACTGTITETDPQAVPTVQANVPGYSGDSGTWRTDTCDLSAYAGRTVLLAFRVITDSGVQGETDRVEPGWYIDQAAIGSLVVTDGSTLTGFSSPTQIFPVRVAAWTVQLVGYHSTNTGVPAFLGSLSLDANFDGTLSGAALQAIIGSQADLVGVIVTYNEPTESISNYAPYSLTINGVKQPGGGT